MSEAAAPLASMPAAPEILGRFRNVRQVFRGPAGQSFVAIDDVSFDLAKGSLVSLLGPSGCGKTSFLRIAAGLTRATSGVVEVRGEAVLRPHRDFGFVFQQPNLMPWRTVIANVLFPMEIAHRNDAKARARARELLDLTGLQEFEDFYPGQLSGGMQQRAALCRALVPRPALLLMDEPFGALDPVTRAELQREFRTLARRLDKTIVFVTHDIREALLLASRIGLLHAGRLVALASPREFLRLDHPEVRAFAASLEVPNGAAP